MKKSRQPSFTRKSPVLASLALACALSSVSTSAFAFSDVPAFGQRLVEFIETTRKRIQEYTDAIATMNHYKQQALDLANALDPSKINLMPHPMENVQERPLDFGMKERCDKGATDSGLNPIALITSLIPISMSGNWAQRQKETCRQMVVVENYRYNDIVKAMKELKKLETAHNLVVSNAKSATKEGQNSQNLTAATVTLTSVQIQYAKIDYTNRLYDDLLKSLNENMKTQAQQGLNGGEKDLLSTVGGALISSGVLKLALNGQQSPCPAGFSSACN